MVEDVKASRGILICNAGFTKKAKEYAINKGIDLCTAHDASQKEWKNEIKIPILRKHAFVAYNLCIPVEITKELKENGKNPLIRIIKGPKGIVLKRSDGTETNFLDEMTIKWNVNAIQTEDGKYRMKFDDVYLDMFPENPSIPVKPLELEYEVKNKYYFKMFTPDEYRGIRNFITEKFKPSFIVIADLNPFEKDKTWKFIQNPKEIKLEAVQLEIDEMTFDTFKFRRARWIS